MSTFTVNGKRDKNQPLRSNGDLGRLADDLRKQAKADTAARLDKSAKRYKKLTKTTSAPKPPKAEVVS